MQIFAGLFAFWWFMCSFSPPVIDCELRTLFTSFPIMIIALMTSFHVFPQIDIVSQTFTADMALEFPCFQMLHFLMIAQWTFPCGCKITSIIVKRKRLSVVMELLMLLEGIVAVRAEVTGWAGESLLVEVYLISMLFPLIAAFALKLTVRTLTFDTRQDYGSSVTLMPQFITL